MKKFKLKNEVDDKLSDLIMDSIDNSIRCSVINFVINSTFPLTWQKIRTAINKDSEIWWHLIDDNIYNEFIKNE
jgi:hypothetical protein